VKEIIRNLWLGDDNDVDEAKKRDYSRLCCCKDGIDSHRSLIGYTTLGAPKDNYYYAAKKGNVLALNLIDSPDPDMIPDVVIDAGLKFLKSEMDADRKVFVHCNAGHSRSPSIVLMFLRAIGELPQGFTRAEQIFKTLYPKYDPGKGMRTHARTRWKSLATFFKR
jgi:hypothetical protein